MVDEENVKVLELDKNYIKSCIQLVLNNLHTHPDKKVMDDRKEDRLNIACPVCGDSKDKHRVKRGWLFYDSLMYKCYNDNCRSSFTQLCKIAKVQLDPSKKLEVLQYTALNVKFKPKEDDFHTLTNTQFISLKDMEEVFNGGTSKFTEFKPIQKGSKAYYYLINRSILDHVDIYECNHWITNKWSEYSIIFLNRAGDRVLGAQTRNLKEDKKKRMFKIYNYEELFKLVYPEKEIVEEEINYLNKISYFFNILKVNFEEKITLFEGFTDCIFYPNSLGMVGLNTDYNFLLENDMDVQFFFDNDDTGKKNTLKLISENKACFLWQKLFEDISKKQVDSHHALHQLVIKIKDLNKLASFFKNPYKELNLSNYFSKDIFDKIFIKYEEEPKKKKLLQRWTTSTTYK